MNPPSIALVTGASRGIGLAIATRLAADGYDIVGSATSAAGLDALHAALDASGRLRAALELDVTDPASLEAACATLDTQGMWPQVLINNAGMTRDNLLLRMKDEEWSAVMAANLTAIFSLTRRCVRAMLKQRFGRIINITSVVASSGNPGQVNYAAAKAGVEGFTRALALEVANRNVTCNTVAPGLVDTDMTRKLTADQRDALIARIPLGRMASGDEVAAAVAFLASAQASYITGHTLHVNGGMYMA